MFGHLRTDVYDKDRIFFWVVLLVVRFQLLRTIASAGIPSSNYFFPCISYFVEMFFNN